MYTKVSSRVLIPVTLALAVIVPSAAHAQGARVTLRALSDGSPVEGAQVTAGTVGSLTNAEGESVLVLPAGEHRLSVSRIGYAPVELFLELLVGADTTVVVTLEEDIIETQGILVTSTRTERRIQDEPLRVEVVSREEVEEKMLMTPGDIAMLLNETAGLRVQPTSPSLGGASVRIQGLLGRYTQILSDGLPLYGGQSGALGPLQIPPMDLGQVEVIKGAASALYGSTAMGGVVNLISRRPEDERELLLNQSTLGGTDAILWLADKVNERWAYSMLTSLNRQDQADVDNDGWADLPSFRRVVARPRLFWDDGRGRSLFLTVGGMAENREGGTTEGGSTPAGGSFVEELETRRVDGGLVGRALISGSRLITARASAMSQGHDHFFGDFLERDLHRTFFTEAALSGQDGSHAWVLGTAMQHERYTSRDVSQFDFTHTIPGAFLQDEYAPTRWLTLSASARLDKHSEYGGFLSPRVSALVRSGDWVIRTSAGTGYFGPSPFTEETEAVGLNRLEVFQDLKAERVRSGMLDVGRSFGGWEMNATLFGSEVDDPLVVRRASAGRLALLNSPEPVRTWGTELLTRLEQGPSHATATYVYTRSQELDPYSSGRREVPLTPQHTVGMVGAWEDEDRGRIGAELYYTGLQSLDENPYRTESEPYVSLGFLVEWRVGRTRVFLNAENLLDSRQTTYDRLVLPARSPEGRWITDVWAPLEGRALNGGVRLAF